MKPWPSSGTKRSSRSSSGAAKLAGPSEDTIQAQVIRWATLQAGVYPELARLFHVPNGGQRHAAVAAKLKGQGVKAGVPDLFLPVPRYGRPGLWIEMKTATGTLSKAQKDWGEFLEGAGYRVEVCRSFDQARIVLLDYLNPKVPFSSGVI